MSEDPSAATPGGRLAGAAPALLARIQRGLAGTVPGSGTRRCPCCGGPIRAGQRLITIHGTSVHARCASAPR